MTAMILYGISILFSPGPVTLVALSKGLRGQFKQSTGYYVSIGLATYLLILIYGYTGQHLIKKEYLSYVGILGCLYMLWLSHKMFLHNINVSEQSHKAMGFREGFIMQFLNPKASLAALPLATVQFPMLGIDGHEILLMSLIFFIMGIASPALYCFAGQYFSRFIRQEKLLNRFNKGMAVMLSAVAVFIFLETVL